MKRRSGSSLGVRRSTASRYIRTVGWSEAAMPPERRLCWNRSRPATGSADSTFEERRRLSVIPRASVAVPECAHPPRNDGHHETSSAKPARTLFYLSDDGMTIGQRSYRRAMFDGPSGGRLWGRPAPAPGDHRAGWCLVVVRRGRSRQILRIGFVSHGRGPNGAAELVHRRQILLREPIVADSAAKGEEKVLRDVSEMSGGRAS